MKTKNMAYGFIQKENLTFTVRDQIKAFQDDITEIKNRCNIFTDI